MNVRTSAVGLALAALVLFPRTAHAEETPAERDDDRALAALAVGGGITMVSLGVGASMISLSEARYVRAGGLLGAQSGMVLAPLAAHAIVGEARRGLWFSLPLLVPVAANALVVGFEPGVVRRAPAGVQWTVYLSASFSIFGATYGVLDALRAGERRKSAAAPGSRSFAIVPLLGGGTAGALVSGSL